MVIFLEFFAFGLLTAPMIAVLNEAFPSHTFLMNGLIQGVKGILSFLCAPLIGALSDRYGRKPFLLLTVAFTCCPIPLINISHLWYFTAVSLSGMFSVTFSVVLAYVSDVTTKKDRAWAYGLVSATFAASLIISPALGAHLAKMVNEMFVIVLSTFVAILDLLFIIICVPESLTEAGRRRTASGNTTSLSQSAASPGNHLTWDEIDPFLAIRRVSKDKLTLLVCSTTFLSYLPEAGEYSCFFVYLRLVIGFSEESVALFIAVCGLTSCIAQTFILGSLIVLMSPKRAIIVGLVFESIQLSIFGFFSQAWVLWSAGCVAGLGSITYPALSAFLSNHSAADQQGLSQGIITGIRGLCLGIGPALYGLIFYLFQVDLQSHLTNQSSLSLQRAIMPPMDEQKAGLLPHIKSLQESVLPGPPFAFGSILVLLAVVIAIFLPEDTSPPGSHSRSTFGTVTVRQSLFETPNSPETNRDSDQDEADFNSSITHYLSEKKDLLSHPMGPALKPYADPKQHGFFRGLMTSTGGHKLPRHLIRSTARSRLVNPLRLLFSASASLSWSRAQPHTLSPEADCLESGDLANFRHHPLVEDLFEAKQALLRPKQAIRLEQSSGEARVGRRLTSRASNQPPLDSTPSYVQQDTTTSTTPTQSSVAWPYPEDNRP